MTVYAVLYIDRRF